jgi:hypothetical protein
MKRTITALIAGVLAAGAAAGQALAEAAPPPSASPSQTVAQLAGNSQSANASATSTQIKPENTNVSVRVLSPGSSGPVSQSNNSAAAAIAANANQLDQTASQTSGGDYPGGYSTPVQSAGQVAESKQSADAWANSTQIKPKNTNVSVRVLSPGDDGDVTQENSSAALGLALNKNDTTQTATQDAGAGSPLQTAAQAAKSYQDATGTAVSKQIEPENTNVSVRVLSHGKNGSVDQKNSSKAIGIGANFNRTEQTATQSGGGYGTPIQDAAQAAYSKQSACGCASSIQVKPKNTNVSVRALSPGDDGDVSQENTSFALGIAANKNHTDQTVTQEQGHGYGDVAVQAAGQIASNDQDAWASAESVQIKPENSNLSVRTLDLGHEPKDKSRDGGEVSQTNSSKALAVSLNVNDLVQTADQSRGGDMKDKPYDDKSDYDKPDYDKPDYDKPDYDKPDYKDEEDGGVSQLNKSLAAALSLNVNKTTQTATQSQDGKGDVAIQAIGQVAGNEQNADSNADSFQYGARNENGSLGDLDLCKKHDFCKPEKPRDCKHDWCKPDPCKKHDWCKPDPCKKHDSCKPDWKRVPCKHEGWCKRDPCKHRNMHIPEYDRCDRPVPLDRKQVVPDAAE